MEKFNHKPKKSLGQNFLQDGETLDKIVEAGELKEGDNVLEIGPGTGVLTKKLLKLAGKVIAIEKDEVLAGKLATDLQLPITNCWNKTGESFNPKSQILEGDILKINLPKLVSESDFYDYKVIANIPYYITGKLLRILLEAKYKPSLMVLLVQKEVAERVCAKPGQMSKLAVAVQFYGKPEILGIVERDKFYPVPEVDSAILRIKLKKPEEFPYQDREKIAEYFKLINIGFSNRRKTLTNNLSSGFKISKEDGEEVLVKLGFDSKIRAQELSVEDWELLRKNKERS